MCLFIQISVLLTYIGISLSKSDLITRVRKWSFGKVDSFILTKTLEKSKAQTGRDSSLSMRTKEVC